MERNRPYRITFGRRIFRFLFGFFLVFVLLFSTFSIIIQTSYVQNKIIDQVTNFINRKTDVHASIGKISLSWKGSVRLENVYFEDLDRDTLLQGLSIETNLIRDFIGLFQNRLFLSHVQLNSVVFRLKTDKEGDTNIDKYLNVLFPPSNGSSGNFNLQLRNIALYNCVFHQINESHHLTIQTGNSKFHVSDVNLKPLRFDFSYAFMDSPIISIQSIRSDEPPNQEVPFNIDSVYIYSFNINRLQLRNGQFILDNIAHKDYSDEIDYNHLFVKPIDLVAVNFKFNHLHEYSAHDFKLSCTEKSGFKIDSLIANRVCVDHKSALFEGIKIYTPYSEIKDTVRLNYSHYRDFLDFNNNVFLNFNISDSKIGIRDIHYFAPDAFGRSYVSNHLDHQIYVDGIVSSRINNLSAYNLSLHYNDIVHFEGNFGSRNISNIKNASFNIDIKSLSTQISKIGVLFPSISKNEHVRKMGKIDYSGRIDGFYSDFVTYGTLRTSIGQAKTDLRLELADNILMSKYSGTIQLSRFDVGQFLNDTTFGTLTLNANISHGSGFDIKRLKLNSDIQIVDFTYNDYKYENVMLEGQFAHSLFIGTIDVRNPAIDLTFDARIDLSDSIPNYKFQGIVNNLDLQLMQLTKESVLINTIMDVELKGRSFDNLISTFKLHDFNIDYKNKRQAKTSLIDISILNSDSISHYSVQSNLFQCELNGRFKIVELGSIVNDMFIQTLPEFFTFINVYNDRKNTFQSTYLNFNFLIPDASILGSILDLPISGDTIVSNCNLNIITNTFNLDMYAANFCYDIYRVDNLNLLLRHDNFISDINIETDQFSVSDNHISDVSVNLLRSYSIYQILASVSDQFPKTLYLNTVATFSDSISQWRIISDSLVFLDQNWNVNSKNLVTFSKNFISIDNLSFENENNKFSLKDFRNKGIIAHIENIPFSRLNSLANNSGIDLEGYANIDIMIRDIFHFKDFGLLLTSDDLIVNNDHFGSLYVTGALANLVSKIELQIDIENVNERIYCNGSIDYYKKSFDEFIMDFSVEIFNMPAAIAEYFISEQISNTIGTVSGSVDLFGTFLQPKMNGNLDLDNVSTVFDYTNVKYRIPDGKVFILDDRIDFSGIHIYDQDNNVGIVKGGFYHKNFKSWTIQCEVESDRLIVLNTSLLNNYTYYGYGIGRVYLIISGTFSAVDMHANFTTAKGTSFNIPVNTTNSQVKANYIQFVNRSIEEQVEAINVRNSGISLLMDIEITPDAEVQIIFDSRSGDILKSIGSGNIRVNVPRNGSLMMYGDYIINSGNYLFTFQNLVNKNFVVDRGGSITWNGDPFDAIINIRASYLTSGTPTYNLILEYLNTSNTNIEQLAKSPTDINLVLNLSGNLLKPDIVFDLEFPRLFGELRSLVESKVYALRRDPNEMNWQIFGLLLSNNFLPPGLSTQGTEYIATVNTVSEMISNQFSRYVTALMSELISTNSVISDIGFDFNYNVFQAQNITDFNNTFTDSRIKVSQRLNFYDDRLSLAVEGSVTNTRGVEANSNVLLGGDFMVEYVLTDDRKLKMRIYQRTEPTVLGNNRYKVGAGLIYRNSFK